MESFILNYATTIWSPAVYLIIFLGMFVEGDIFIFITSFLLHQGFLNPLLAFTVAFIGVIVSDSFWYYFGVALKRHPSFLGRWIERATKTFDGHIVNRSFHTILISKFAYGAYHIILVRCGMLDLKYKSFIKYDFFSSLIWILIIGALGYIFSASFSLVRQYLHFAEIALLLGLIIFYFLHLFIEKMIKKKL